VKAPAHGRAILLLSLLLAAIAPAAAQATVPITSFSTTPLSTQAGGHPDLHVSIKLASGFQEVTEQPRDLTVNTPPGLVGLPTNMPRCTAVEFATEDCPVDSQIGIAFIEAPPFTASAVAIFNMVPRNEEVALIAVETPVVGPQPIYTSFTVRTESDYGLESKTFGVTRLVYLDNSQYIFWGVPGDHSHDALRFPAAPESFWTGSTVHKDKQFGCGFDLTPQLLEGINPLQQPLGICSNLVEFKSQLPVTPYNGEVRPFFTNATDCDAGKSSSLDVLTYDRGTTHADTPFPQMTGCALLSFNPNQAIQPTTTAADSPSGADLVVNVPQPFSPEAPSASSLRAASVTLPAGFTVAPNLTNGKTVCTDVEAKIGSREQAQCPESSKIGTIAVESPALPAPLKGAAYLGEPKPGDRYRTLFVFDGFSLHIKLPGSILLDPQTGQITIRFANLPEAPFSRFTAHIFGSERGPLATPPDCGTYPVESKFEPWDAALPDQSATQFFVIDSGPDGTPCPPATHPFGPGFEAGTTDNTAGAHTPFTLDLSRGDAEQNLSSLTVATPPGFSATLAGVPYCPEAAIARLGDPSYLGVSELESPACPAASRVGSVTVGTGAGSHPLYVDGKVYLAGPYRAAPLSLVIVVPAVSGPYDLGNVAVRAAVYVDPLTAAVRTVSDPIPQIVAGIPLRSRQVRIELDRPGFTLNPTNCDPFSISATFSGDQGAVAAAVARFQVANCAGLVYRPKFSLGLSGGVNRRGHPAIHALFEARAGEANTRAVTVTLPQGELLDQRHLRTICTRLDFAAHRCPAGSLIGRAEATSPLLDGTLTGPVYLRSSSHDLPDLAIPLDGQVDIELVGRVDSVDARLRTTFESVPDAPISRFSLRLLGGAKGLLQNTESLCLGPKRATTRMVGQNGARLDTKTKLRVACGAKSRHKRATGHDGKAGE
jgi:hypothetical protein